ncbi:hypothetical protein PspLS_10785 [Pyricularia sp. CBS 133598]|nr:hypothetical protein PspLS_10785 [Pyricularia sp. CBS 133598]
MQSGSIVPFFIAASITVTPAIAMKPRRTNFECTISISKIQTPEQPPLTIHTYSNSVVPVELDGEKRNLQLVDCTPLQGNLPNGYHLDSVPVSKYSFTALQSN